MQELLNQLGDGSLVLVARKINTPTGQTVEGDFAVRGLSNTEAIGMVEVIKAKIIEATTEKAGVAFKKG